MPPRLPDALAGSDAIVDAMLGTGFEGAPRAPLDAAIDAVNSAEAPVIAVDVPSGVNAATGEIEGACVRADVTVTFHGAKVGLCVDPGKSAAGRVEVVPIGIPPDRYGAPPPGTAGLIRPQARGALAAAGCRLHEVLLRLGAGRGRVDRPHRCGLSRLRGGDARRRRMGARRDPRIAQPVFEVKLTEVMSVPLPDAGGALPPPRPTPCSRRRSVRTPWRSARGWAGPRDRSPSPSI